MKQKPKKLGGPRIVEVVVPGPGQPKARLGGGPRIVDVRVPDYEPRRPAKSSIQVDRNAATLFRKLSRAERRQYSEMLLMLIEDWVAAKHPDWTVERSKTRHEQMET